MSDRASYSAPILVKQAGDDVVICWTGDSVAGLNPGSGEIHWRYPFAPKNMPIGIATPVVHKDRVFVTSFYDGSLMLQLMQDTDAAIRKELYLLLTEEEFEAFYRPLQAPGAPFTPLIDWGDTGP